jgi:hypothetical protein
MDRSKEIEHDAGKKGLPKKAIFTKMWLRRELRPVLLRRVMDPSRTRDMRLLSSSQVSSVGAHEEIGSSGGDQYEE